MKVKITCQCGASFELISNSRNKGDYVCPNCLRPLPSDASKELHALFDNYEVFSAKLEASERYTATLQN